MANQLSEEDTVLLARISTKIRTIQTASTELSQIAGMISLAGSKEPKDQFGRTLSVETCKEIKAEAIKRLNKIIPASKQ